MRLTELNPKWIVKDGLRVGFVFKSPTDPKWYQLCKFVVMGNREQWDLCTELLKDTIGPDWKGLPPVQTARADVCWTCTPDPQTADFGVLTIKPSIDGSAGGLWHGWITGGHIE